MSEANNLYESLKNDPTEAIAWAKREIKEYEALKTISNEKELIYWADFQIEGFNKFLKLACLQMKK